MYRGQRRVGAQVQLWTVPRILCRLEWANRHTPPPISHNTCCTAPVALTVLWDNTSGLSPMNPLPAGSPPTPGLFGNGMAKGQGFPAREGVPARGFLGLWAVWAWEHHKPGSLASQPLKARETPVNSRRVRNPTSGTFTWGDPHGGCGFFPL